MTARKVTFSDLKMQPGFIQYALCAPLTEGQIFYRQVPWSQPVPGITGFQPAGRHPTAGGCSRDGGGSGACVSCTGPACRAVQGLGTDAVAACRLQQLRAVHQLSECI